MAAVSLKPLKQWYRDSESIPKRVIARTRYLGKRLRIRTIRAAWTIFSLPALVSAYLQQATNPLGAQKQYEKLVGRNPWIRGALEALVATANKNGDIQTALEAALKRDRLTQKNHGDVTGFWTEYLLGEPGWFLPQVTLTGSQVLDLNETLLNAERRNLDRLPNYAESELAVLTEQIANKAAQIQINLATSNLEVVLVGLALGVNPIPVNRDVFTSAAESATQVQKRRMNKFQELKDQGLIEVQK